MDIKRKVIDISSFLLFEATGDSETGCFDPAMSVINHDDDDDAESCSRDTTKSDLILPCVRELDNLEYTADVSDDDDDEEVVQRQKEARLHKKCRDAHQRFNGRAAKGNKPSSVSVDSAKTTMDEKNKLFWEACLAS